MATIGIICSDIYDQIQGTVNLSNIKVPQRISAKKPIWFSTWTPENSQWPRIYHYGRHRGPPLDSVILPPSQPASQPALSYVHSSSLQHHTLVGIFDLHMQLVTYATFTFKPSIGCCLSNKMQNLEHGYKAPKYLVPSYLPTLSLLSLFHGYFN